MEHDSIIYQRDLAYPETCQPGFVPGFEDSQAKWGHNQPHYMDGEPKAYRSEGIVFQNYL